MPSLIDVEALPACAEELDRAGYADFLACFNPLVPRPSAWRSARAGVPPALGAVVDLFLLGRGVSPAALPSGVGRLVPGLAAAGLLTERADGLVEADGIVVVHVFGTWLICHPPQVDPLFYLGEDSIALLRRLTPAAAATGLDLCAGPGLHAVHLARSVPDVVAVERDPAAARLAGLNAGLNRVSDRVRVHIGDLFEPVAGRRFDLIAANPPSLPYPADLPGPRIGHGGEDGLRLTGRVLLGLPDALTDGGRAYLVGMALTDGRAGRLGDWLRAVARERGLRIQCGVLAHAPMRAGSGTYERIVAVVGAIARAGRDQVHEGYARGLDRLQASHLSTFALRVMRGRGELDLLDVAIAGREGLWHV